METTQKKLTRLFDLSELQLDRSSAAKNTDQHHNFLFFLFDHIHNAGKPVEGTVDHTNFVAFLKPDDLCGLCRAGLNLLQDLCDLVVWNRSRVSDCR